MNCQEIQMASGWSGISLSLIPENPSVESILAPLGDNLVILFSDNGIYYPDAGLNTIGEWDNNSGYVVKLENPQNLNVCGEPLQNSSLSINEGWNYLPVLSPNPVNSTELFSGVINYVDIVKEVAGTKLIWPSKNINTLENLEPGRSYLLKANNTFSLDFSNNGLFLINENFEEYEIGTFPESGGWELHYNGSGSNDQHISDNYSNSVNNSIKLSGTSGWRAELIKNISVSSDETIIYEVSFFAVPDDPGGRCCFFNPEIGAWGTSVATVAFYDNVVKCAGNEIYNYQDNEWVYVKLEYSQSLNLINVWVNSNQVLFNYEIDENTVSITHFSISTRYGAGSCINYWDDIKVLKEE